MGTFEIGWIIIVLLFIAGLGWIIGSELNNADDPHYGREW